MKVTLIQPAIGRKKGKIYKRPWTLEPLAIATLAGLTPQGIALQFYDDRIEEINFDEPTDLVGITVETFTALRSYQIAEKFRKRRVPVVLGGVHPTLLPEEGLQHADAVVVGQAEDLWPEVLHDAKQNSLQRIYRENGQPSLDKIVVDRHIFKGKKYLPITLIEHGRGCPFHCEFCDIPVYYNGRYDVRPLDRVVNEMRESKNKNFLIVDDNLASQPKQLKEFADAIKPLNVKWGGQASITLARHESLLDDLAASGCFGLLLGFESLDPRNLAVMNKSFNVPIQYEQAIKRFHYRKIRIYGSFIVGYDHDTPECVNEMVDFAIQQKIFIANFNPLTPIPGTRFYDRLKLEGRFTKEKWWLDPNFRYGDFVFALPNMTADEVSNLCEESKDKFYSARSIFRRAFSKANAGNLHSAFMYILANIMTSREVKGKRELRLGL